MNPERPLPTVEISGLTVYPVKSMKGIALESAMLEPEGLAHDRRFMVVTAGGRFVTQRDNPRLALVHTRLLGDGIELSTTQDGSVFVPFDGPDGDTIHSAVWGDPCETVDQGEEIGRWLSTTLESRDELRLVRMAPAFRRPQGQADLLGASTHTVFADAAPFLIANEASLDELNRELQQRGHDPVPMNRFRPNIILRGLDAFAEHRLAGIAAGGYGFGFAHPCERCVVTTIDQDNATANPEREPFRTLCDINPVPGEQRAPAFAQNAILSSGQGTRIHVGDTLSMTGWTS